MIAKTVANTMPSRIAARQRSASMTMVTTRPNTVTASGTIGTVPSSTSPTGVPPLTLMSPPSTSPMNRMKKPMPTTIAFLSSIGIALKIASRKPVMTRMVMATPSRTMRPMASAIVSPWPRTRLNATTALSPMPGAMA